MKVGKGAALAAAVLVMCTVEAAAPSPSIPIVVELFTSEGCSSCPPADALLLKLVVNQPVPGAQILALGEHVDYWDRLGWRDRFSSAVLTSRQRLYGSRFNDDSIYTPQMVVDGQAGFVGSDAAAARRELERAAARPHVPVQVAVESLNPTTLNVAVTSAALEKNSSDHVDLVVALTEDGLRSEVTRGENHGRMLSHAAVVRHLASIGEAAADHTTTASAKIELPSEWRRDSLKVVAFAQERRHRAILGSAIAPVQSR
jgi:hypothetical protein